MKILGGAATSSNELIYYSDHFQSIAILKNIRMK